MKIKNQSFKESDFFLKSHTNFISYSLKIFKIKIKIFKKYLKIKIFKNIYFQNKIK